MKFQRTFKDRVEGNTFTLPGSQMVYMKTEVTYDKFGGPRNAVKLFSTGGLEASAGNEYFFPDWTFVVPVQIYISDII